MHNRGNGKGGGIAAVGLVAEDVGVSQEVLDSHYLLQIALLDPTARDGGRRGSSSRRIFDVALSMRSPDGRRLPRHPGPGGPAARRAALPRAREARRALRTFAEQQRAGGPAAARGRGRVRLPEQLPPERQLLRVAGREAGVRALARAKPAGLQDRRLRRADRPVLPAGGLAGRTSGSPTSATRPRAASGIRAARTRSSA